VVAAPVIAPSSRCTFCSISSVFIGNLRNVVDQACHRR
jgi:hypothetical protein